MKVLVIGSGGREHAICWKISQSPLLTKAWCLPGNPGIAKITECININVIDIDAIVSFAVAHKVDLVIPGPESCLVLGLTNALEAVSIPCCGPSKEAARLEGSKSFVKKICEEEFIPTAYSETFTGYEEATALLDLCSSYPMVVKADGLASGKGVFIVHDYEEAEKIVKSLIVDRDYGKAGETIVIEDYIFGEETSFFFLCDGETVLPLGSAKDYKKLYNTDVGPNTGGMGSISPSPLASLEKEIVNTMVLPTLHYMKMNKTPFKGILFAGVIVSGDEILSPETPWLLEYNVRFGDPECQSLMLRMKSDLLDLLYKAATGTLSGSSVEWHDDTAVTVVMASKGYPGPMETGDTIVTHEDEFPPNVSLFHSGTSMTNTNLISSGGRVLSVSGIGPNALDDVYDSISKIEFDCHYRTDIGH